MISNATIYYDAYREPIPKTAEWLTKSWTTEVPIYCMDRKAVVNLDANVTQDAFQSRMPEQSVVSCPSPPVICLPMT